MKIDVRETFLQLRAMFRICFLKPNSWREIAIALIAVTFAPLVVLVCILSNTKFVGDKDW
ncbi:hypothetical protein [Candidatus Uabimicrobium amorphum]|uniref:hypothetical protein n=1 Tax=Uabimicrobium amorphum TaxID=2596890 RepID=UPI00125FEF1A|nr:hypothetical protein [Candidatus Uabimicrobium amorphum]